MKRLVLLLLTVMAIGACTPTVKKLADDEPEKPVESSDETIELASEDEVAEPEMDRDAIQSRTYTIPRANPYGTGTYVISAEENAFSNSDFEKGQEDWEINTVDGVVFDQGLKVSDQSSERQHVILRQGVTGFEKMKSYLLKIDGSSDSEVAVKLRILQPEENEVLLSLEGVMSEEGIVFDFPMNHDLIDGGVVEMDFEVSSNQVMVIERVYLVRKQHDLIWSDEFNEEGLPDSDKWGYDEGGSGWGNSERQYYTAGDEDNTIIKDGVLNIIAMEPYTPKNTII